MENGICYHSRCLYIPNLECMKRREYDRKIAKAHKITRNAIKRVKSFGNGGLHRNKSYKGE